MRLQNMSPAAVPSESHAAVDGGDIDIDDFNAEMDHDGVLDEVGFGSFQLLLVLLCGWANSSEAVELTAVSFVLDDLTSSSSFKSAIGAIIFLGMFVGGPLFGTYADRVGRRRCLILTLAINGIGGFASALAPNLSVLLFLRFVSGIGVGGSIPVVFSYFCEFLPKNSRGRYMSVIASCWMIGAILTAAWAWAILPRSFSFELLGSVFTPWRVFLAVCGLPSIISAVAVAFAPETPRFLWTSGDRQAALDLYRHMYEANHDIDADVAAFDPKDFVSNNTLSDAGRLEDEEIFGDGDANDSHAVSTVAHDEPVNGHAGAEEEQALFASSRRKSSGAHRFESTSRVLSLFRPPLLRPSLQLMVIWFSLSFGYYGLTLWMPTYFKVSAVSVYMSAFLSAVAQLPGNILSILFMDAFGRARTLALTMTVAGIAVFVLLRVKEAWQVTLMACIFSAVTVGGWNALGIASTELYATEKRATAYGVFASVGRIAAIAGIFVFGAFVHVHPAIPLTIISCMLVVGGIVSLWLPPSARKPIQ